MGGKKPIGAAPSRGHHHNTAHSGHHHGNPSTGHRVWSTPQFSYWGSETVFNQPAAQQSVVPPTHSIATPTPPPPSQPDRSIEALEKRITDLSSELANVKDSVTISNSGTPSESDMFLSGLSDSRPLSRLFAGEYEEEAREDDDFPLLLFSSPQVGGSRSTNQSRSLDDMWRRIDVMEDDIRRLNNRDEHIHSLEMAVRSLTDRVNKTEQLAKTNTMLTPTKTTQPISPNIEGRKQLSSSPSSETNGSRLSYASEPFTPTTQGPSELRRLQDRVRTLEGRQGALQSKISAADSVLGRTGAAWATSLKAMADVVEGGGGGEGGGEGALEELIRRVDAIEATK